MSNGTSTPAKTAHPSRSLRRELAYWRQFRAAWRSLSPSEQAEHLASLSDDDIAALNWFWIEYARDSQLPPEREHGIWLIKTGRGWGKTRVGAELTDEVARSGEVEWIHLIAPTAADARDTMVEGESGILAVAKPGQRPEYEPSKRRVTWPNGCTATLFSAEEPDRLRGPQCGFWWADELAAWKYADETWDNIQFGARLGADVRGVITTTPRPVPLVKKLLKDPRVVITSGSTFENEANLASSFIAAIREKYEGTRLGRQELAGELLDDNPDALWRREWIERDRLAKVPVNLQRVVVALDPSATPTGDEAGITVQGRGADSRYYALADYSLQGSPDAWAKQAVVAYHFHKADVLVYEANQGGDMVKAVIRNVDPSVNTKAVTASRGKVTRAEPIAALSEQGKISHIGHLPKLEDELCEWTPGSNDSPNRLDAYVWGMTELSSRAMPAFIDRRKLGI